MGILGGVSSGAIFYILVIILENFTGLSQEVTIGLSFAVVLGVLIDYLIRLIDILSVQIKEANKLREKTNEILMDIYSK